MLELAIAFVGGGALTAIIKGVFDLIRARHQREKNFSITIGKMNKIYNLLDALKSDINCDRVLVLKTTNGGGIPRPGASLYVSALYETYDSDFFSIGEWWQHRKIDESYVKMLGRLEEEEIIILETDELEDGILKDVYESQNVKVSVLCRIKESDNKYYFISCNFKDPSKIRGTKTKVRVMDYVDSIRKII